jgi:NAD(P)-dependent dehydrogenase (short-subunit alcohol dehydrogenase family)
MVLTGSEAHRFATPIDLDALGTSPQRRAGQLSAELAYGTSKLLPMLFTRELARRIDGTGIRANSFCPGLVATNLNGDSAFTRVAERLSATPLVRRPEQGARMGVRLATDPELATVNGRFFTSTPGARLLPPRRILSDVDFQRQLWDRTAALVGLDATEEPPPTLAR